MVDSNPGINGNGESSGLRPSLSELKTKVRCDGPEGHACDAFSESKESRHLAHLDSKDARRPQHAKMTVRSIAPSLPGPATAIAAGRSVFSTPLPTGSVSFVSSDGKKADYSSRSPKCQGGAAVSSGEVLGDDEDLDEATRNAVKGLLLLGECINLGTDDASVKTYKGGEGTHWSKAVEPFNAEKQGCSSRNHPRESQVTTSTGGGQREFDIGPCLDYEGQAVLEALDSRIAGLQALCAEDDVDKPAYKILRREYNSD